MKRKFLKSAISLALAATLLFGEAGLAMTAEAKAGGDQKTKQAVVNVDKDVEATAASAASISYLNVYTYTDSVNVYFLGYGDKFEIYVNNVLEQTIANRQYEYQYDETTGESSSVPQKAPYYSDDVSLYVPMQQGASYTVKVVAYEYNSTVKGAQKSKTISSSFLKISSVSGEAVGAFDYDENGQTTGFEKLFGISIRANLEGYIGCTNRFEIQRSQKKTSGFKKVATISSDSSYSISWMDSDVTLGKTYYYKIRPVVVQDKYVKAKVGKFSPVYGVVAGKPSASCWVSYETDGVFIGLHESAFVSGVEIYRSTKKSSGYKKIATVSDDFYLDKGVKTGTYYYKVKPFYYNKTTGKKLYGDSSEPQGVKLILGDLYAEAEQNGKNQVKLSWNPVKGAERYEIYMKSDVEGDAYKYVGATNKTAFTVKRLASDSSYYFQIRAYKEAKNVKSYYQSNQLSVNLEISAPRNLRIAKKTVSIKGNTMTITSTLKWDRVFGAKKYVVRAYDTVKKEYVTLKTINNAATTSYKLTNKKAKDGSFRYTEVRVAAVNGKNESVSWVYDVANLSNPKSVKVKRNTATSAKITWARVTGADTYLVYRKRPNGREVFLGSTDKTSYVDKKLTPGINYTYRVEANNRKFNVYGSYSSDSMTNIAIYKHALSRTSITSVKNTAAKKATITWKKAPYAKRYIVYRATSKNGKYNKVGVTSKTSFTDTKLTKGKKYYYKVEVQAVNDAGFTVTSAKSAEKAVEIKK